MKFKGNLSLFAIQLLLLTLITSGCGRAQNPITVEPILSSVKIKQSEINELSQLSDSFPSKIIGENNLVPVKVDGSNLEANLRNVIDAFGLININGQGACSATHLGNGYALSAGHCFLDENNPAAQTATNKDCTTVKVYWGYRGSPKTGNAKPLITLTSQCLKVVYAELSKSRDFAIFKVDQAPKAKIAISTDTKRTPTGTKLTIFGYPQARPLEWSQYCALQPKSVIGAGAGAVVSEFAHQCDTEPGNSGSSILSITSMGTVKVVGIHDGASPADYNYGTFMFDARDTVKKHGVDLDQVTGAAFSSSF